MQIVLSWIAANPALFSMVVWPMLTFVITFLFRNHSEDEYARLPSWLAHIVRFTSAFGVSAPDVISFLKLLFTSASKNAGGKAGAILLLLGLSFAIVPVESACNLSPKTVHDLEVIGLNAEQAACIIAKDAMGLKEPAELQAACAIPPSTWQTLFDGLSKDQIKEKMRDPLFKAKLKHRASTPGDAGAHDAACLLEAAVTL